jgi:hypothetical protein
MLCGNEFGDEGAWSLADVLKANQILLCISLDGIGIGDEGAESLAVSLMVSYNLREIYLTNNEITNKGAAKLAYALKCNCSIEKLLLSHNHLMGRIEVGGPVQDFPLLVFFSGRNPGTIFFEASPN